MKHLLWSAVAGLLVACTGSGSSGLSDVTNENSEQDVRDFMTQVWDNAYVNKDTVLLDQLLHNDFMMVDDDGSTFQKEDEMSYVGEYGDTYENFTYQYLDINLFENGTAMVYLDCRLAGIDLNGAYVNTYKQSCSLVKKVGGWQMIGYHVSGVKEERLEDAPSE